MSDITVVPIPKYELAKKAFYRFVADLTPDRVKLGTGPDRVDFDPYAHVSRDEAIDAFLAKSPQHAGFRESLRDVMPDLKGFAFSEPKWNRYRETIRQ